jgi:LysM repeat protein
VPGNHGHAPRTRAAKKSHRRAPKNTTAPPPARTQAGRYTITKGDTISSVAARFGITTQSILTANGLSATSIIYPGQTVMIPGREPVPLPAPAPVIGTAIDAPRDSAPLASSALADADTTRVAALVSVAAAVVALPIAERPVMPVSPAPRAPAPRSPAEPTSPSAPPSGGSITPLTAEMRANAATIIRVGRELSVPQYGIVIALATAMQESSLRNLSWGDRDSVGLFQQRPSSGWGTAADLQVPSHAARLFYVGRPGFTRGLLGVPGWQSMTLTQAAQAVQISAYPNHYAKWEASAWAWYYELT